MRSLKAEKPKDDYSQKEKKTKNKNKITSQHDYFLLWTQI
jgi:hypothetical protein